MFIRVKIVPNDISTVAKVVLVDERNRVLFLKRSGSIEKYPNQWDLPGGHLQENESLLAGLKREVFEETGLTVENPLFITKIGRTHFFMAKYDSMPIKLSHEHKAYTFLSKESLKAKDKYQKVALMVLEDKK